MKRALLLATLLAPLSTLAAGFEGGYVGLYTGYAWAEDKGTSYDQTTGQKNNWTLDTNPRGVQYGALGGYNWPLQNNWLVGVEADLEGRIDGSDRSIHEFNGIRVETFPGTSDIEASGSLRGRLGYLPSTDLLLFATAGYAYAQIEREWQDGLTGLSESHSDGQGGWTVGIGAEYLLSDAISARVEYRYADYGTAEDIDVDMWNEEFKQRLTEQSLRLGAAYHF